MAMMIQLAVFALALATAAFVFWRTLAPAMPRILALLAGGVDAGPVAVAVPVRVRRASTAASAQRSALSPWRVAA